MKHSRIRWGGTAVKSVREFLGGTGILPVLDSTATIKLKSQLSSVARTGCKPVPPKKDCTGKMTLPPVRLARC